MEYAKIKKIWIVGASSGIGEALAKLLADDGKQVVISARSKDALDKIAATSPLIESVVVDVTDIKSIAAAMKKIGDFDSVIQCAGTYKPDSVDNFTADGFSKHFAVNVLGTGNILEPILKYFKSKGQGHIAITASVAGYHGLPKSLSYGPTKAALINLCEALAIELYNTDISVQVINPGFVETPLTAQNDFDMPMIITPEKAAEAIVKGMKKGNFEITFPWVFSRILRRIAALPYCLSIPLISRGTKGKM